MYKCGQNPLQSSFKPFCVRLEKHDPLLLQYHAHAMRTYFSLQAGDADTNGAVAGALLGCKLGASKLPDSWRDKLKHKDWLHGHISK